MSTLYQTVAVLTGLCVGVLLLVLTSTTLYEKEETQLLEEEGEYATILFGGDMLFDRYIRQVANRNGEEFVFSCIEEMLQEADMVVANLEGPITSNDSLSTGTTPGGEGNYTFTHPPYTAQLLKRYNIHLVNLANNHIWNFGRRGVEETLAFLEAEDISYIGDPFSYSVKKQKVHSVPIAFIAFTEFGGESFDEVVQKVVDANTAGYVPVVYTHWGDEYVDVNAQQREWGRGFAEAGAALVVGSHPHVVQEHEVWQGTPIYYSLGNFIFDQYFSERVREGSLLKVLFDVDGVVETEEIPVVLEKDGRTCVSK